MHDEAFKYRRGRTGFMALVALFALASEAGAQTTQPVPSWIEKRGFQQYDTSTAFSGNAPLETVAPRELATTVARTIAQQSPPEAVATPIAREQNGPNNEEIIVTGSVQPLSTPHPEFDSNFFADRGITPIRNPNTEGLAFLTREERLEAESWSGVSIPIPGTGRAGEPGFFMSGEFKRGGGIRAGLRF